MESGETKKSCESEQVVQIIMIKYTDGSQHMKARLVLSDGADFVMAILSQEIFDKLVCLIYD